MRRALRAGPILVAAALAACTSYQSGKTLSEDWIGSIQKGETTRRDIHGWFGEPTSRKLYAGGRAVWVYESEHTQARDTRKVTQLLCWLGALAGSRCYVGSPVNVREERRTRQVLTLHFSPAGIVEDYSYEREEQPSRGIYFGAAPQQAAPRGEWGQPPPSAGPARVREARG